MSHITRYMRDMGEGSFGKILPSTSSCSWYRQLYTPEEFDAMPSQLNEFEQANVNLMLEIRKERNDKYL